MVTNFPHEDQLHPALSMKTFSITFPGFLSELTMAKRIQQIYDWAHPFPSVYSAGSQSFFHDATELAADSSQGKQSVYLNVYRDLNGLSFFLNDLKLYLKSGDTVIFKDFYNSNPKSKYYTLTGLSTVLHKDMTQLKNDRRKIDNALAPSCHQFKHTVLANIKN